MDSITEIKKLLEQKKIVIGTELAIKGLRNKKIKKIFTSSNCPQDILDDLNKYAGLNNAELIKLDIPNEELGIICKKPFFVSVLGVLE